MVPKRAAALTALMFVGSVAVSVNGAAVAQGSQYSSAPELSHQGLMQLFMAANRDLIYGEYFALENYMAFHVPHSDELGRPSEQCRSLQHLARNNEIEFRSFVAGTVAVLKEDLAAAENWPQTSIFKIRERRRLNDYDRALGGFPISTIGEPGAVFGREIMVPRATRYGEWFAKPASFCSVSPPNRATMTADWTGVEVFPGTATGLRAGFRLDIQPRDANTFLPMAPARASPLRSSGLRYVDIEVLLEAGPATFNARKPGLVPARMIAARAINPDTDEVLHEFEIPSIETSDASDRAVADSSQGVEFRSHFLDLLAVKRLPQILTDDALIGLSERQVRAEMSALSAIDSRLESQERQRSAGFPGDGLHPDHPILLYPFQNGGSNAEHVARLFLDGGASWDFATSDPRFDPRFSHIIDAHVFDPDTIRGRDPGFVAREQLSAFRDHMRAVAEYAPERLVFDVELPRVAYDFDAKALKFEAGRRGEFSDGEQILGAINYRIDDDAVQGRFLYSSRISESRSSATPGVSGNPGIKHAGTSPSAAWRRSSQEFVGLSGRVETLALDRELVLSSIDIDTAEIEGLLAELGSLRQGLRARVSVMMGAAELAALVNPNSSTREAVLFDVRLEGVDIVAPSGRVVASLQPSDFRDREAVDRDEQSRNRLVMPTVRGGGDMVALTAGTRELLVAKHDPGSLGDGMIARMMLSRWINENNALRNGTALPDGEIFIRRDRREPELVAFPEGKALQDALPQFRGWIEQTARSLPERLSVDIPLSKVAPGVFPGGIAWPGGFNGGQSSCVRQLRFIESNMGPAEAEIFASACEFLRAYETQPGSSFSCLTRGGFSGVRWNCGGSREESNAVIKAAESVADVPVLMDRITLDQFVTISDEAASRAKGRRASLKLIVDLVNLQRNDILAPGRNSEAVDVVNAYLSRNGQDPFRYPDDVESVDHWEMKVSVISAELVETETGEVLAALQTEALPELPLQLLKEPETATGSGFGTGPYGPDALGIRLGMSFDEADRAIRNFMSVGEVLHADRRWTVGPNMQDQDWYTSGRFYISRDLQQAVTLYDEPPHAAGVVSGATIQLLVNKTPGIDKDFFAQLIRKYGQPTHWVNGTTRPGQSPYWVEAPADDTTGDSKPWGRSNGSCLGANYWNFNLRKLWRDETGTDRGSLDNPRFSRFPDLVRPHDRPNSACTSAVTATVDMESFGDLAALNIWLFDTLAYHRAFEESRKAPPVELAVNDRGGAEGSGADPLASFLSNAPAQGAAPKTEVATADRATSSATSGERRIEVPISAPNDDVEQAPTGGMYMDSSDLELVDDPGGNGLHQIVGMRFTNVGVPNGAVIRSARIRFVSEGSPKVDPTILQIFGLDADHVPEFTYNPNDLVLRQMSPSFVEWQPEPWQAPDVRHETPDLRDLVQSIVNRPGWQAGNAMGFVVLGAGERSAYSYDGDPSKAAVLVVSFGEVGASSDQIAGESGAPAGTRPDIDFDGSFDVVGLRLGMTFDEADRVVRESMDVGRVLRANRQWNSVGLSDQFRPFTSGRLYISSDEGEVIILYDEPPSAESVVTAVVRQLRLPKGQFPAQAVTDQLRQKYGPETLLSRNLMRSPVLTWSSPDSPVALNEFNFNALCHPLKMNMFALGHWNSEDGSHVGSSMRFVTAPMPDAHAAGDMNKDSTQDCGAAVSATVDTVSDNQWDSLSIWLYDSKAYGTLNELSRKGMEGGSGGSGPKIKL